MVGTGSSIRGARKYSRTLYHHRPPISARIGPTIRSIPVTAELTTRYRPVLKPTVAAGVIVQTPRPAPGRSAPGRLADGGTHLRKPAPSRRWERRRPRDRQVY